MKILKIYNIIATVLVIILAVYATSLYKELQETEEVLQQCENRYYKEIEE